MMRVVSSIYHQLLKYLTPSEMVNIRGDQAMARTVAAVTQKRSGWMQKAFRVYPNEALLWIRSRRALLINSNQTSVRDQTLTHLPSRRIPTAGPKKSQSHLG